MGTSTVSAELATADADIHRNECTINGQGDVDERNTMVVAVIDGVTGKHVQPDTRFLIKGETALAKTRTRRYSSRSRNALRFVSFNRSIPEPPRHGCIAGGDPSGQRLSLHRT